MSSGIPRMDPADRPAKNVVLTRQHASLNFGAEDQKPITGDEVLQLRQVSSAVHLLDCCSIPWR
jgi:hypothetical protein